MNQQTARSSFVAMAIAIVIWVVLGLIFIDSRQTIALWAIIIAIATFVVTSSISTIVRRSKGSSS
ncbi:MAG: hypothetical protein QM589_16105 [Thermomicrobiales bacterium]